MVQLDRFARRNNRVVKRNNKENIQKEIQLQTTDSDTAEEDTHLFTLEAMIAHKGPANGGHYYALIKRSDGMWNKCDDREITCVAEEDYKKLQGEGENKKERDEGVPYLILYRNQGTTQTQPRYTG